MYPNTQSPSPLQNPYINPLINPPQQGNQNPSQSQPNQGQGQNQQSPALNAIMQSLASRQMATDPRYASQVNSNPPSPANSISVPGVNAVAGAAATANNIRTVAPPVNQMQIQPPPQSTQQSNPLVSAISQLLGYFNEGSTAAKAGQTISNDPNYAGMCEAYAEQQIYGKQGMYPTAYAAYQANATKGNINPSMQNIPAGSQLFFSPSQLNGYNGHTGVMNSDGTFTSPLYNGNIEKFTLQDFINYTGQQYLGYAPPVG